MFAQAFARDLPGVAAAARHLARSAAVTGCISLARSSSLDRLGATGLGATPCFERSIRGTPFITGTLGPGLLTPWCLLRNVAPIAGATELVRRAAVANTQRSRAATGCRWKYVMPFIGPNTVQQKCRTHQRND